MNTLTEVAALRELVRDVVREVLDERGKRAPGAARERELVT